MFCICDNLCGLKYTNEKLGNRDETNRFISVFLKASSLKERLGYARIDKQNIV